MSADDSFKNNAGAGANFPTDDPRCCTYSTEGETVVVCDAEYRFRGLTDGGPEEGR